MKNFQDCMLNLLNKDSNTDLKKITKRTLLITLLGREILHRERLFGNEPNFVLR